MKELLKELQLQKDQCDLMHDKAIQLEMKLKNTKVHFLSCIVSSFFGNYFSILLDQYFSLIVFINYLQKFLNVFLKAWHQIHIHKYV